MPELFGTDRVLLFDVDPWNRLGFGAPAFGHDNIGTLCLPIHNLTNEIGRLQLFIMTHVDAMRTKPPSVNTVMRIGKMLNRVQSVLGTRQRDYNELRLEPGHVRPATLVWNIHPVPFFDGPIVRNPWLREYNALVMFALSNMFQHSDNDLSLTVTKAFAEHVYQYFGEIKRLLGSELLQIPLDELKQDGFVFTAAHYQNYHPDQVTIDIEALDGPGPIFSLPTEDDLRPLLDGYPANMILPRLKQYPIGPVPGAQGIAGRDLIDGSISAEGTGGIGGGGGPAIGDPVLWPSTSAKNDNAGGVGSGAATGPVVGPPRI